MCSYRERGDPQVWAEHVVQVGEGAPGHVVSLSAGCSDQQSLVLEPYDWLLLIRASFDPKTYKNNTL